MTPKQAKAMKRGQFMLKHASKAMRRKWAAKAARTRAMKRAAAMNPEVNAADTKDIYAGGEDVTAFAENPMSRKGYEYTIKKNAHGEYVVKFHKDGQWLGEGPTYYAGDREDALGTAIAQIKRYNEFDRPMASNPELMIVSSNPGRSRKKKNGSTKMKRCKKRKSSGRRKSSRRKKGAGRRIRYARKLRSVSWLRKNLSKRKFNRLAKRKGLKRLA